MRSIKFDELPHKAGLQRPARTLITVAEAVPIVPTPPTAAIVAPPAPPDPKVSSSK